MVRYESSYLSRMKLQRELIIHQRLQPDIIFVRVILVPLEVDLANSLLVRQITLNRDVAGIDQQVFASVSRDTVQGSAFAAQQE